MTMEELFQELPGVNPKTGEPPALYHCGLCGALVVNRKKHLSWHKTINRKIKNGPENEWPPLED